MKCAWKELLSIFPTQYQGMVSGYETSGLQEIRLRLHNEPELVLMNRRVRLKKEVSSEDLSYVVNVASRYSPWLASTSSAGYITAPGGHRIGLCGDAVMKNGEMTGFRSLRSINIRLCRDLPGCSGELHRLKGSVLIIGKPGSGKTTLLRDLIRKRSQKENTAVVDERMELFPERAGFDMGIHTDILSGCGKERGIELLLRTMGPDLIAVDEITAQEDCEALLHAGWCGVSLLATAHAGCRKDLFARPIYASLVKSGIFDHLVILQADKTWHSERMIP